MEGEQGFEETLEELEAEGIGSVGFGVGWVVVDFKKEAVNSGGDGRAREERNKLGLAAADAVGGGGLLHGVGGVEDDGGERAHDGQRAEIDDEVVVAKGCAALGEEDALVTCRADLLEPVAHVPGRDELALLDVNGAPSAASGDQQIGLTAEESGNLQDVDGFGGDFAVGRLMNVGEDRQTGVFGEAAKDASSFHEAGTTETLYAGAIGLVVAGLEDVGNAEIGRDALDGFGHFACVGFGLDNAGTGDQEEPARAHLHGADFKRGGHEGDCTGDSEQWSVVRGPSLVAGSQEAVAAAGEGIPRPRKRNLGRPP